jgi:cation diffusion facilitator family transporter
MKDTDLAPYRHDHCFGQDRVSRGERRTLIVVALTAVFMVVEIAAGLAYGSMALLADGLHMGSHALALGISVAAYVYARRRAGDLRFSFGTGKVNALGGFTGAILLLGFAVLMAWESVGRLVNPVPIVFDQAIAVAVLGLVVNGVSVALLGVHSHDHDHGHDHSHGHGHGEHEVSAPPSEAQPDQAHDHTHDHEHAHSAEPSPEVQTSNASAANEDHNLRSAYLHVLADALTSFFAIFALLGGKVFGLTWLDPVMGIAGSLLITSWSWGLLRQTSSVLLDHQAPAPLRERVREALEEGGDRVADLHVWSIGPGVWASEACIVSGAPRPPGEIKARIPAELGLEHVTIEVHDFSTSSED